MLVITLGILIPCLAYSTFRLGKIAGDSMHPTYTDGEYVLVRKVHLKHKIVEGEVYAIHRRDTNEYIIKRVTHLLNVSPNQYLFVEGDNEEVSLDSRHYGYLPREWVVGKVVDTKIRRGKVRIDEDTKSFK